MGQTRHLHCHAAGPVFRKAFDQLIASKFPALDGAVRLKCKGNYVHSLSVPFEWGDAPGQPIKTKGGENSYGNCGKEITVPGKP